jgi:hypothetical protein
MKSLKSNELETVSKGGSVLSVERRRGRAPRISFGLVPLTAPFLDSDLDLRVLNAVAAGLLYERMEVAPAELGMTKLELSRTLRSMRNSGIIFANSEGRYMISFDTSNFPNLIARENTF